jgi:hypothetical protein
MDRSFISGSIILAMIWVACFGLRLTNLMVNIAFAAFILPNVGLYIRLWILDRQKQKTANSR